MIYLKNKNEIIRRLILIKMNKSKNFLVRGFNRKNVIIGVYP